MGAANTFIYRRKQEYSVMRTFVISDLNLDCDNEQTVLVSVSTLCVSTLQMTTGLGRIVE